jgi:hypothetical protein
VTRTPQQTPIPHRDQFFPKPHTGRTSGTEHTITRTIIQIQLLEAPEDGPVSPKHVELHLKFRIKLVY